MSYTLNQQQQIKSPQFYEEKANQLRMENQILKRQLENNSNIYNLKSSTNQYSTGRSPASYPFQGQIPVQQVIYNPVSQPIRPGFHPDNNLIYQTLPHKSRMESYPVYPQRDGRYITQSMGAYTDYERKVQMNQVQDEIVQLQTRGYKLQRQANKLSSFIKQDLKDFVKDSNIHKECNYKQKYLRAITSRPRYFRFNM